MKPYVIGLDLGGTNSVFGIVDSRGEIKATTAIKTQGFDGCISIEFEGREESVFAAQRSLDNVKRLFKFGIKNRCITNLNFNIRSLASFDVFFYL